MANANLGMHYEALLGRDRRTLFVGLRNLNLQLARERHLY